MSSSDPNTPNDPYRKSPYGEPSPQQPGQPPPQDREQPRGHPQAPPSGPYDPYGGPGGAPPGAAPSKVNTSRMIFFVAAGIQALFSLLAIVTFAAAQNRLEDVYGDLGIGTGIYYTLFTLFLIHAIAGLVLAAKMPRGGNGLRVGAIVWSALLILVGLATLPLGFLWIVLGIVCIVLLSSTESAAWFNRLRT
ncbi:hypothetical protein GCM10010420_49750 [Streptomyces glaucosporus]|uniref:Integral membrane protein n=1 Tax=Streptomyces glaucosporus TaxID=284044 RepID=A0ABP5VX42_9ACTN